MKIFLSIKRLVLPVLASAIFFSACNKLELDPVPAEQPAPGTGSTLAELLNDPGYSLLKAAATRAGLMSQLADSSLNFTLYAPDNTAIAYSVSIIKPGVDPLDYIQDSLSVTEVASLVMYHVSAQRIPTASIPASFPNFQYPSILNPSVGLPSYNPFVRLTTFPSKRGSAVWVNNVPVIAPDVNAVNGVLHKVATIVLPPSTPLWSRIATDTSLSFFKAAVERADSGTTATIGQLNQNNLQSVMTEFGPNLTVFAPTNNAFRSILYATAYPLIYQQIYGATYQAFINGGAPADVAAARATDTANLKASPTTTFYTGTPTFFQNPLFSSVLTAQVVKGIVVYHILGTRAFSVNLPTTATNVPTLLNSAVPVHPGVSIAATFAGPSVSGATVKGAVNPTASNILINPLPNPYGTSDQHFINGVLHKIDQVLRPQ